MNPAHPYTNSHELSAIDEALESQNANRVTSLNQMLAKPEFGPLRTRLGLLTYRLGGEVFFVNPTVSSTDHLGFVTSVQRFVSPGLQFRDRRSADPDKCHQYVVQRDGSLRNLTKRIQRWERALSKGMVLPPRQQLAELVASSN